MRGSRRAARATRKPRRVGAALGWAIGVTVVALFGVAGAAVATGQVGQWVGFSSQAAANASGSPSATSPSTTPTPSPSLTPTETPTPAPPPPPVSPADTPCATTVTISVWAHYDDDLIFANPTLQDAMAAGDCLRSVFVTASDAGKGGDYSQRRELGILRAYNTMRGQEGFWSEKSVTLLTGAVLRQWSPDGDPDVTVAFLRLPDGGMEGEGFGATGYGSLSKLLSGSIPALAPIDDARPLSSETLVASLAETIQAYHAARVITHVPSTAAQWAEGDHPDHGATGTFARAAWQRAGYSAAQVLYAVGYPSASLPVNVTGETLARKLEPYRVYAAHDSVVSCATDTACLAKPRFGDWLQRSYFVTDAEIFPAG